MLFRNFVDSISRPRNARGATEVPIRAHYSHPDRKVLDDERLTSKTYSSRQNYRNSCLFTVIDYKRVICAVFFTQK